MPENKEQENSESDIDMLAGYRLNTEEILLCDVVILEEMLCDVVIVFTVVLKFF